MCYTVLLKIRHKIIITLEIRPILRGKYSTFQLRAHSIPIYSIYGRRPLPKIRNYPSFSKGRQTIRGAEFLEELRY